MADSPAALPSQPPAAYACRSVHTCTGGGSAAGSCAHRNLTLRCTLLAVARAAATIAAGLNAACMVVPTSTTYGTLLQHRSHRDACAS